MRETMDAHPHHDGTSGSLAGPRAGADDADFAILLTVAVRCLVDQLTGGLEAAGFPDVRPQYGYVFRALYPSGMTSTELASILHVSKQAVVKLIDELEARGFVARHPDADDRRAKIVRLTERGRRVVETARRISADLEASLTAEVGDESVAAMRR